MKRTMLDILSFAAAVAFIVFWILAILILPP